MKKTILFLSAALCLMFQTSGLKAQDRTDDFVPHWFIELQAGAGYTVGETAFGKLVSPAAAFNFGYRFTPVWSLRAGIGGWQAKGAVVNTETSVYAFNYLQGNVDVMADICSIFAGYKSDRLFTPYLFAGVGVNGAFNNKQALAAPSSYRDLDMRWEKNSISPAGHFGIGTGIRLCDAVSINVELGSSVMNDAFNSKKESSADWQLEAKAGLTFNLGLKKARKASAARSYDNAPVPAAKPAEPESAPVEKAAEPEKKTGTTASEPVKEKAKPAFKQVQEEVFFLIGRYDISEAEMQKVSQLIQVLVSNPETKVSVTGYADGQTGSAKRNMYLSQKRAEAVAEALKAAGISGDRISVAYKGSTESPFDTPQKNRVAVCIVK